MRPKTKEYVSISMRMEKSAYDMLERYCEDAGQSKTVAIERAVKAYVEAYEKKKAYEKESEKSVLEM